MFAPTFFGRSFKSHRIVCRIYLRKQRLNTNLATETLSTFVVLQKHLHKEALKKENNKRSTDSQLNSEKIQSMTL